MKFLKKSLLVIVFMGSVEISNASIKQICVSKIDTAVKLNNSGNSISAVEKLTTAVDSGSMTTLYLSLQSLKFGDKRILRLTVQATVSGIQRIGREQMFFTLSGGGVIGLANLNNETAKFNQGGNTTQISGNYQLTDNDEMRLCSDKVVGLQLQYDGGVFRFMLKEAEAKILQRQCLALK